MTYWSTLGQVLIRALIAVLLCAVLVAIYSGIDGAMNASFESAATGWAAMGFIGTIILGLPAAALYGAPLYVFLMRNSALSWPRVLLIGALPSAFILFFDREMALLFLICGVLVAGGTHLLTMMRPLTARSSSP